MTDDARDAFGFTQRERDIIASMRRSPIWQRVAEFVEHERNQLFSADALDLDGAGAERKLWVREGQIKAWNRLLREGPHLAVYYDRYLREQEEKGVAAEPPRTAGPRPPGEDPEVGNGR